MACVQICFLKHRHSDRQIANLRFNGLNTETSAVAGWRQPGQVIRKHRSNGATLITKCKVSGVIITYAHLPAGYVACRVLADRFEKRIESYPLYLFWGLFGAIAPDTDYLYQYLFDYRNYDHHFYLTHYPVFWVTLLAGSMLWLASSKKNQSPLFAFIFFLNGFMHIVLDTITSPIYWLAPFSYDHSICGETALSYLLPFSFDEHPDWGYAFEAVIIFWAIHLFLRSLQKKVRAT